MPQQKNIVKEVKKSEKSVAKQPIKTRKTKTIPTPPSSVYDDDDDDDDDSF